jgi:hypothetical protein
MIGSYTRNQLKFIKTLLAVRTPDVKILADFRQKYIDNVIYGEDIDEIRENCEDEIREIAKKELSDNNAVACSFTRVRLEIIQMAIMDCITPKFLGSSPVTKEFDDDRPPQTTYKEKVGIDHANLCKLLDLAQKEDFFARKLRLEKLSRGITSSDPVLDGAGTPCVTVFTGYDSEDQKLLVETHPIDGEVVEDGQD